MNDSIIKVIGVGKSYIISHEGRESYTALRDVISRKAKKMIGGGASRLTTKEEFWALKDVNFDIKQGEAVGIIGRNGAGKSTLLKVLSRITEPTHGRIEIKGRVASLLEVGTGFHPELSGRENIYLNGAILGMSREEIKRKFDEIVDFSGVEKFLDTPVKRYSSGMYVRLAFSVAAHLEPEILVVDEVLAVGDAEFQKKCLGKMGEVSKNEGRTVLFVSHNFIAVRSLCTRSVLLDKGTVKAIGRTEDVLNEYLSAQTKSSRVDLNEKLNGRNENQFVAVSSIELLANCASEGIFELDKQFTIRVNLINKSVQSKININLFFYNSDNILIFATCSSPQQVPRGGFEAVCDFPADFFNDIPYTVSVMVVGNNAPLITIEEAIGIEGLEVNRSSDWLGKFPGLIRPAFKWSLNF